MANRILIIGGVALGPKAASRARRLDPDAEITLVERGDLFSYAGCGMPFYIEGSIDDVSSLLCTSQGVMRDEEYFVKTKGIRVLGRTEALRIDRERKTVTVRDLRDGGVRELPYDKLVLGVGAKPIVPRMEGIDLGGVYRLYSPRDAQAIRSELDSGVRSVAIIGGGLIGMEVCGAFVSRGCRVDVFEMMDRLVPALLDEELSLLLENYLRERGVGIHTGSPVKGFRGEGGRVTTVITSDGGEHEAEMVIVAIGVRPNTELAREAGLEIGATGAIAVNELLQTSDPDIYAGGDCVENTCILTGRKVYAPMGSTANKHGRVIGDNVTGGSTRFPGVSSTVVFRVLDYNVGKTGLTEREAEALGYKVVTALTPRSDCSSYYPGSSSFIVKLVADRETQRVLGVQGMGLGEAVKRIDVVATALKFDATLKDLADLDLAYAPPYSTAIDAIAHAANVVRNKIEGLARGVPPVALRARLEGDEDFVLLDVRSEEEFREGSLSDRRVVNIPLNELRDRRDELPRDGEIIIFCRTSVRAYEAQRILEGLGFRDVKFLDGSLKAWPYPL